MISLRWKLGFNINGFTPSLNHKIRVEELYETSTMLTSSDIDIEIW